MKRLPALSSCLRGALLRLPRGAQPSGWRHAHACPRPLRSGGAATRLQHTCRTTHRCRCGRCPRAPPLSPLRSAPHSMLAACTAAPKPLLIADWRTKRGARRARRAQQQYQHSAWLFSSQVLQPSTKGQKVATGSPSPTDLTNPRSACGGPTAVLPVGSPYNWPLSRTYPSLSP
jgi:hypothetical protein